MGLDSYIYRVKKPEGLADKVYSSDELRNMGLDAVLAEYQDDPLICELKPYCVTVRVESPYINMQSIRDAYDFGEDAYVVAQHSDGSIVVHEKRPNGTEHSQEISGTEMRDKHLLNLVDEHIVFRKERIAYWRKDYNIEAFFANKHDDGIENTGYYILDLETIKEFNSRFSPKLPEEAPSEDSALYYWEWY